MRNKIYADGNYLIVDDGVSVPVAYPKVDTVYSEDLESFTLKNNVTNDYLHVPIASSSAWASNATAAVNLSGTVTLTGSSKDVVGAGTKFTSELKVGELIQLSTVDYTVESITDDTHLSLTIVYATTTASGITAKGYNTFYTASTLRTLLRANTKVYPL